MLILSVSENYEEDKAGNVKHNHQAAKHTEGVKHRKLDGAEEDRPTPFHLSTSTIHCSHFSQNLFDR